MEDKRPLYFTPKPGNSMLLKKKQTKKLVDIFAAIFQCYQHFTGNKLALSATGLPSFMSRSRLAISVQPAKPALPND